ncbi:MAG: HNH endonuclease [Nitrospira sp.]|nr:MAG: HNH endonuclease [Nitrospira sp.]
MADNVLSYIEMCRREGTSLQAGMNFGLGGSHSVILMSVRPNAPYRDRLEDGGTTLIYEGHDEPKGSAVSNPKVVDQPGTYPSGTPTQNGRFHRAAQEAKTGARAPERVRVYEKIRTGIWSYNGIFLLVDSWQEDDEYRRVFKFKLMAVEGEEDLSIPAVLNPTRRRVIPTAVKLEVWKRDSGKCVMCGATDELHFDHDLPWAKGGTSLAASNVQLLCARHNIAKRDRIR